jgi:hypothetical protein
LIPNPLVHADDGGPVRLDTVLQGRTAVLTARKPAADLAGLCRRRHLLLIMVRSAPEAGNFALAMDADAAAGDWINVRLGADGAPAGLRALISNPALAIVVRPDRVIASAATRARLPHLPWSTPAGTPKRANRSPVT